MRKVSLVPLPLPPDLPTPWRVVVRERLPMGVYRDEDKGWWLALPVLQGLTLYRLGMGRPLIWGMVVGELFLYPPTPASRRELEEGLRELGLPPEPLRVGDTLTLVWELSPYPNWGRLVLKVEETRPGGWLGLWVPPRKRGLGPSK
ncbi:DNA polymerase III subunits gamma and tau [Thermus sp. CCB_US3_UF1]|nr:DNA polymerase III subunits gamma and tau [Thermus sp. CCB_US3_UF1]